MRIVVTGAAGFLGSHLTDQLLAQGHEVIGIDSLITGSLDNLKQLENNKAFRFVKSDVTQYIHVPGPVERVYHFASPASPLDAQPGQVPQARRSTSPRRAPRGAARHRQDAPRPRRRRGSGSALLQHLGIRVRRDVRRRRRVARARPFRRRRRPPRRSSSSTRSTPSDGSAAPALAAATTSASRRSTSSWPRWTASTNDDVVVIAATNRPDVLDPALLRPGRFDRQVTVGYPDRRGREAILRIHTRSIPLGTDVDLAPLAAGDLPASSGADLANLANEAALMAARLGRGDVAMAQFEESMDKVLLGTRQACADRSGGAANGRVPRRRARPRRRPHARGGPGAEDLDRPARHAPRRHHLGTRQRPLQLRQAEPARPRQGRDRWPRRRRGRLRRRNDRRGVRHPPGDPARSQHGRPLRNERGDRLPLRPAAGRRRLRPDARRLGDLRAGPGSGSTTRCGASSANSTTPRYSCSPTTASSSTRSPRRSSRPRPSRGRRRTPRQGCKRRRQSPRSSARRITMLPLSDGLHPRRFPIVNVALISANFAVWILYEQPHLASAVSTARSTPAPSTTPAGARSRGRSAGSPQCSCTEAGATSSETCSSSPSSARTSRTPSATSATSPSTSPAASSRR